MATEISEASAEQSSGINEINQAVAQMDEATQQNAALVEESTAAAGSMVQQARQLSELISFFKVDDQSEDSIVAIKGHGFRDYTDEDDQLLEGVH